MQADSFAITAKIILFFLGTMSFIVFWLSGTHKYYLLYIGFGFCSLGISLFFNKQFFVIAALLLTLYAFVIAIIEGIKDTKTRLANFRKEQEGREIAFAEFQAALIENEKKNKDNNATKVEDDNSSTL